MLSDSKPTCCDSCRNEYRNQRLAQLYAIIRGEYNDSIGSNMTNTTIGKGIKAASSSSFNPITTTTTTKKRIVINPNRQKEKATKLASLIEEERRREASNVNIYTERAARFGELEKYIKGE